MKGHDALVVKARNCRLCAPHLPHQPNPIFSTAPSTKVLIIGQAPGLKAHERNIAFDDPSGDRLRDWLSVSRETFYNPSLISVLPMGFCFPGYKNGADAPPRKECAPAWHNDFLLYLKPEVTLYVGRYSQQYYLPQHKTLTEAVRRKPYSVVLFDEIEKAHPDVVQLLLQVLEEGRLTDSLGRKIDFRNTILIMTSNVGADILQKDTSMGFGVEVNADSEYEKIRDKILDETKRIFKPEFLNRLNDLVIFRSLRMEDMNAIVDLELLNLSNRLKGQELFFDLDDASKEFIIKKGYDEKFGARPLKRAIERFLEDSLAEAILEGTIKRGEKINVSLNDTKDGLMFNQDSLASKANH